MTNPHDAWAGTSTVLEADSNPKKVAFTRDVTFAFTKGFEVKALGGMQIFMVGGIGDGHTGIGSPVKDVGNVN
jgi:hypothetical protein